MVIRLIVAVTVLVSVWSPSKAEADASLQPMQSYAGVGANTCDRFTSFYRESPTTAKRMFVSWTQGFLSGFFIGRELTLAKVDRWPDGEFKGEFKLRPPGWDRGAQWDYLLRYCSLYPHAKFLDAVIGLMGELRLAQPTQGTD